MRIETTKQPKPGQRNIALCRHMAPARAMGERSFTLLLHVSLSPSQPWLQFPPYLCHTQQKKTMQLCRWRCPVELELSLIGRSVRAHSHLVLFCYQLVNLPDKETRHLSITLLLLEEIQPSYVWLFYHPMCCVFSAREPLIPRGFNRVCNILKGSVCLHIDRYAWPKNRLYNQITLDHTIK